MIKTRRLQLCLFLLLSGAASVPVWANETLVISGGTVPQKEVLEPKAEALLKAPPLPGLNKPPLLPLPLWFPIPPPPWGTSPTPRFIPKSWLPPLVEFPRELPPPP